MERKKAVIYTKSCKHFTDEKLTKLIDEIYEKARQLHYEITGCYYDGQNSCYEMLDDLIDDLVDCDNTQVLISCLGDASKKSMEVCKIREKLAKFEVIYID